MDEDLMQQILAMGSDEEAIADLLREAERQEKRSDSTRGNSYLMDAGHGNVVANPYQAVADMFIRGNAEKKAQEARDQVPNMRAVGNEKTKAYLDSLLNRGLGGIDLNKAMDPSVKAGGPLAIPNAPQVTPPAPEKAPDPFANVQGGGSTPPPPPPGPRVPNAPQGPIPQAAPGAPGLPGGGAPGMAGAMFSTPGAPYGDLGKKLAEALGMSEQDADVQSLLAGLRQ